MAKTKPDKWKSSYRSLRKEKPGRLKLWLALGILLLALLFVGSLYGAYHQKLLISQVAVEGNKTVSDFEIRQVVDRQLATKYWSLYPKRNALLFPRDQVIAAVATAFPRLSSIKLEQPDLRSLALSVKERRGEFLWCLPSGDCYFADETGFVFAPAPKFSSPLYFEFSSVNATEPIGKYPLPAADLQKLIAGEKKISTILASSTFSGHKVYQARPAELRDWYFRVKNIFGDDKTWEIRLDLDQDFNMAMKTLSSFLVNPDFMKDAEAHESDLEYIDLRFAPKVFYRYNNQ
jgi:hypothetical protein